MKFPAKKLRLVSARAITKGEKSYTFVKLADTSTYENNEFMLSKDFKASDLHVGSDYDVVLDVEGKFSTVFLVPCKKSS